MDDYEPIMEDVPLELPEMPEFTIDDAPWYEDVWDWVNQPGNLQTLIGAAGGIGSGIAGMNQARNLQEMARNAGAAADPFGSQRGQYQQQLAQLMSNPNALYEEPAFKAIMQQGTEAVRRQASAGGFNLSGNETLALEEYGQGAAAKYANDRISQLSLLAGAGITPNYGPSLSGYGAGSELMSQSLGSIGYGLQRAAGGFSSAGGEAAGSDTAEARQAIKLAQLGVKGYGRLTGSDVSGASGALSGAGSVLGIYSGLEQGGVGGYLSAARGAYNLYNLASGAGTAAATGAAASAGASAGTSAASGAASAGSTAAGGIGTALGVAGALYGGYNTIKAWETGDRRSGAMSGASAGASVGTMIAPGVGTLIGAGVGALVGWAGSAIAGKEAAEDKTKVAYFDALSKGMQPGQMNDQAFTEALVGEFRSGASGMPGRWNGTYGKKDDDKFAADMANKINQAYSAGTISSSDTTTDIYLKVIYPWYEQMGGYKRAGDRSKLEGLTMDMISRYTSGRPITWQEARGNAPEYSMPKYLGLGATPATSPTKSPVQAPIKTAPQVRTPYNPSMPFAA